MIALCDLAAMEAFGARIAVRLMAGDVVALTGTLGAGKTTLARAILAGLGHAGEVPSPTFTILETYDGAAMRLPAVHADFYRLDSADQMRELGLDEYRDGGVLIAEWPDKAGGFGHEAQCLSITLETADTGRIAIVSPGANWVSRWP